MAAPTAGSRNAWVVIGRPDLPFLGSVGVHRGGGRRRTAATPAASPAAASNAGNCHTQNINELLLLPGRVRACRACTVRLWTLPPPPCAGPICIPCEPGKLLATTPRPCSARARRGSLSRSRSTCTDRDAGRSGLRGVRFASDLLLLFLLPDAGFGFGFNCASLAGRAGGIADGRLVHVCLAAVTT